VISPEVRIFPSTLRRFAASIYDISITIRGAARSSSCPPSARRTRTPLGPARVFSLPVGVIDAARPARARAHRRMGQFPAKRGRVLGRSRGRLPEAPSIAGLNSVSTPQLRSDSGRAVPPFGRSRPNTYLEAERRTSNRSLNPTAPLARRSGKDARRRAIVRVLA